MFEERKKIMINMKEKNIYDENIKSGVGFMKGTINRVMEGLDFQH